MDLLDRLLDHDYWATGELLRVSGSLTDAQLDQPFDVGHQTVRATFGHMIYNPEFWAGLMIGQPEETQLERDYSLAALIDRHERSYMAFGRLARQLRDEDRLSDIFTDHYDVRKPIGGTILMVVLHNTEHRTEIVHMLARLGVPGPIEVDIGLWDYLMLNP